MTIEPQDKAQETAQSSGGVTLGCILIPVLFVFLIFLGFWGWNLVRIVHLQNQVLNGCIVIEQQGNQTSIHNTGRCK